MTSKTQADTLTLRKCKSTVCPSVTRDNVRPDDAAPTVSVATGSAECRSPCNQQRIGGGNSV